MTSSIETLLRLSAGEITSHTNPFVLIFSFFWCCSFSFFSLFSVLYLSPKWNHEGMTSKGGMLWKAADEIKEWHDKHLGAMYCTFAFFHLVPHIYTVSFHFVLSLGLIVFTSVIRVLAYTISPLPFTVRCCSHARLFRSCLSFVL